jgi:uridine kinase
MPTPSILTHPDLFSAALYEKMQQINAGIAEFERQQDVGYREFREANREVDELFIKSVGQLIRARGAPILLAIAGPTAAGKTEIVERLRGALEAEGRTVAAIEMDNFLTDREQREERGIFTLSQAALHFDLLRRCLADICAGRRVATPRYDFVYATSSHDLDGVLKPGCTPIEIEPADVVFIEGNSPFLFPEIVPLIGIKVVYLTDDPVRLKRKWKRDIDYRKKYEPTYFRNRYFREQFLMAERSYRPQMAACDLLVDTTDAALWATPEIAGMLAG